MSKRSLYVLIGCLVLVALVMVLSVSNNVQNVTPTVTPNITPRVTAVPTATPVPTSTPITIKIVTPVPTQTPVLVEIVTPAPTETVTVMATPTQVPETPVSTETPVVTPEPTAILTEEPTTVPTTTVIPTEIPTTVPTEMPTVEPTEVPTEEPQITPVPEEKYTSVDRELSKITIMGGVYPDYNSAPSYDIYSYIDVNGLDQARLFKIMRKPFESGIAQWTDMKFTSGSAIDMLSFALNSSICENCGRAKISEASTDSSQITAIFDEIERSGDQEVANRLLLDYLYKYTRQNPNNPTERLIISCNDK